MESPSQKQSQPLCAKDLRSIKGDRGKIGSGNFSVVRICFHEELGTVAAKCSEIKRNPAKGEKIKKRIRKETGLLQLVSHENVVRVHDVVQWSNAMAIIMEYQPGGNLMDLLDDEDVNLPYLLRLQMCTDIANGLSYLHSSPDGRSIIHGDVKPDNVLLNEDLKCKISDFGGSEIERLTGSLTEMKTENHITEFYASPELLKRPCASLKPSDDVYSYSMTVAVILLRKIPLTQMQIPLYTTAVKQGQRPALKEIQELIHQKLSKKNKQYDARIAEQLKKVAVRCWHKDCASRPSLCTIKDELNHTLNKHDKTKLRKTIDHTLAQIQLTIPQKEDPSNELIPLDQFNPPGFTVSGGYVTSSEESHSQNSSFQVNTESKQHPGSRVRDWVNHQDPPQDGNPPADLQQAVSNTDDEDERASCATTTILRLQPELELPQSPVTWFELLQSDPELFCTFSQRCVLVQSSRPSRKFTSEELCSYFSDPEASGGGRIKKITLLVDGVLVIFQSEQDADRAVQKEDHSIDGVELRIYKKPIPHVSNNQIILQGNFKKHSTENVEEVIECLTRVPFDIEYRESLDGFLITFEEAVETGDLNNKVKKFSLTHFTPKVMQICGFDCLKVENVPKTAFDDQVKLSFMNKKLANDYVTSVKHSKLGNYLLVYFSNFRDAEKINNISKSENIRVAKTPVSISPWITGINDWEEDSSCLIQPVDVTNPRQRVEYQHAINKFLYTFGKGMSIKILQVCRVESRRAKSIFDLRKKAVTERMKTNKENFPVTRELYFGGTAETCETICKQEFSHTDAEDVGRSTEVFRLSEHGYGVHFDSTCEKAHFWAQPNLRGERKMLLAEVITGKPRQGGRNFDNRSRDFPNNTDDQYDSVVTSLANPTVFIISKERFTECVLPKYLLTYTIKQVEKM